MRQTKRQQGFSLLEILVAFAILTLALGILLKIFSGGVNSAGVAEEYSAAVQIAEGLMAKTGVETPLQAGVVSGQEDERYDWEVVVEPYYADTELPDLKAMNLLLFKVNVLVRWGQGNGREIRLSTLKLTSPKLS